MNIRSLDLHIIRSFRTLTVPVARFGLFLIFFWFGILKVIGTGLSPATPLVEKLFDTTFPFPMTFGTFMVLFGLFEVIIGILFLIRGAERIVIPLLFIHMITTIMPLFFIPEATWSGFLIPTLEGQYIIKNIVIIASAMAVASQVHPFRFKNEK